MKLSYHVTYSVQLYLMLQILYEVDGIRSLRKLYVPHTRKVKVTWMYQNVTLSRTELAAIYPNAVVSYGEGSTVGDGDDDLDNNNDQ